MTIFGRLPFLTLLSSLLESSTSVIAITRTVTLIINSAQQELFSHKKPVTVLKVSQSLPHDQVLHRRYHAKLRSDHAALAEGQLLLGIKAFLYDSFLRMHPSVYICSSSRRLADLRVGEDGLLESDATSPTDRPGQ